MKKPQTLFIIFTLLALLTGAALFLLQAGRSMPVQQDIQYPESAVVFGVFNLWSDQPLYQNFNEPPFAVKVYPPLFYWLSALPAKIFANSVHGVYLTARLVAFSATLTTALMLIFIAKQANFSRFAQWSTALIFLGSSLLLPWGFMARVDSLMLLCAALGLYFFARWRGSNWQYLAALFFALALFTKQSALAGSAAAISFLVFNGQWRRAFLFAFMLSGVLFVGFFGVNFATGGMMKLNVFDGLAAPARWVSVGEVFQNSFRGLLLPLVLAIPVIGFALRQQWQQWQKWRGQDEAGPVETFTVRLIALYLFGAIALAALSSAKLGSDRNYYLETLLAASILAGRAVDWLARQANRSWLRAGLATLLIVGLVWPDHQQKIALAQTDYFVSMDNSAVVERVKQVSGEILSQDANIALRAGKNVYVTDGYHLAVLAEKGHWRLEPLNNLIRQKHFAALVLGFDLHEPEKTAWFHYQTLPIWPPTTLQAMKENYKAGEQQGGYFIYWPK